MRPFSNLVVLVNENAATPDYDIDRATSTQDGCPVEFRAAGSMSKVHNEVGELKYLTGLSIVERVRGALEFSKNAASPISVSLSAARFDLPT